MTWRKRDVRIPTQANNPVQPAAEGSADACPAADTTMGCSAGIGQSVHIQGELTGHEDIVVEGRVDGRITVEEHSLTVGPTGVINAEMRAHSVLVEGRVVGNITADDRVEIAASGSVVGDIRAARVVLFEGARFRGSIDMGLDAAELDDDAGATAPQGAWANAFSNGEHATPMAQNGIDAIEEAFSAAGSKTLSSLFGDTATAKVDG